MNKINGILLLLLYVCVGTALLNDQFVNVGNMQNNLRWTAEFGIIGIGVAFVIITGGIDLSIGSVIGLIGCILAMSLTEWGVSVPVALGLVMLISLVIGLYHGLLVTKLKLPAFVVTLCGLMYFRGLARLLTDDKTQGFGSEYNETLRLFAIGKPCSIAFLTLLSGIAILTWCVWSQSRRRDQNSADVRAVVGLIGLAMVVIGAARYRYGWEFVSGPPLLSIAGFSVPTWNVIVPDAGLVIPQQILLWCGCAVIPGILWLAVTVFQGAHWPRTIAPVVSLAVGAGLVLWATQLVRAADEWFWPDASWARTYRILAVFGALGMLMLAIGWFTRTTREVTEGRASAPLLLTGAAGVSWLIGKTPLGEMLVPSPMIFLIVLGVLAAVFLNQTIYGRYLLALGNNEEAARYSGINTQLMTVVAYMLCSLAAGVAGILFALDLNSIQPNGHGNFYELYAIAAAVLGGCSLRGGEGTIMGVVIGAAVMQVLRNSISMVGMPSSREPLIIGLVLLLGVIADEVMKRLAARRKAIAEGAAVE